VSACRGAGVPAARALRAGALAVLWFALLTAAVPAAADLVGHGGIVRAVAVSSDGRTVLTGGFDYTVRVWDFLEQRQIDRLGEHEGPVNAVSFIGRGERAVSGGDDGQVLLWDVGTATMARRLPPHASRVTALAVSADGRLVASGGWDGLVRVWDLAAERVVRELRQEAPVTALAFTSAADQIVAGDRDGSIRVWSTANGGATIVLGRSGTGVTQVRALASGGQIVTAGIDGSLALWDAAERTELLRLRHSDKPIYALALDADGKTAIAAGWDGSIVHWSLSTGRVVRTIAAHEAPIWSIARSPDGRFVLSAGSEGSVRIWHLETGARIGAPQAANDRDQPWRDSEHPGAHVYRACAACHALTVDEVQRSGPHFAALFGRRAGSLSDYAYSPALQRAAFAWNDDTLRALFREGPEVFVPGSKMPLQQITDEADLDALVEYLRILTAPAGNEDTGRNSGGAAAPGAEEHDRPQQQELAR
jgi:cytochrome c